MVIKDVLGNVVWRMWVLVLKGIYCVIWDLCYVSFLGGGWGGSGFMVILGMYMMSLYVYYDGEVMMLIFVMLFDVEVFGMELLLIKDCEVVLVF